MRCPFCGEDDDRVVDSRSMVNGSAIRRRRECNQCNRRFTTYEHLDEIALMVIKRDGVREPFDRNKIAKSIRVACQKRPISEDSILEVTNTIEQHIFSGMDKEVPSTKIGELVMEHLAKLDQVAYVRFASVYRQFKDINQFMQELSSLLKGQPPGNGTAKSGQSSMKALQSTTHSKQSTSQRHRPLVPPRTITARGRGSITIVKT